MDFFSAQEQARKQSKLLVFYFVVAVALIVVAINAAVWFGLLLTTEPPRPEPAFWDAPRWIGVSIVVLLVIVGASLVRTLQFRQGGGAVAKSLGGRRVDPSTRDPLERRLVNVVEEMAVASGLPMPEVYVLEREEGINAFAAGLNTHDAAVAVTRGALEELSRDELQGVVAHEFAHILNGDMRINVRLAGIIFGIIVLALLGRMVMYSMYFQGGGRRGGDKGGGGAIVLILVIGLTLLVVGVVGEIFGRMIQAAVSRRREYLADASAVQFTRNPDGIAGALKRIGAHQSRVQNSAASGMAHFFFASAMKSSMSGMFATHPPLPKRIRAVDPQWDGAFPEPGKPSKPAAKGDDGSSAQAKPARGGGLRTGEPIWDLSVMMGAIGSLDQRSIQGAHDLIERWPESLRDAVHQREGAKAVLCGLVRSVQQETALPDQLIDQLRPEMKASMNELLPLLRDLEAGNRLPLAEVALGQLRDLGKREYEEMETILRALVEVDGKESLFEACLLQLFRKHARKEDREAPKFSNEELKENVNRLLSRLVHLELEEDGDADAFFERVTRDLRERWLPDLSLVEANHLNKTDPAEEFAALEALPLLVRRWVLEACVAAVIENQSVSESESELLRVVALTMEFPMPLLLPGPIDGDAS